MSGEIDPVQFGRMLASQEALSKKLDQNADRMERLDQRLEALESLRANGKWAAIGLVIGLVFAVYGMKEALGRIADWLTR